jgi:hypothetical protein
MASLALETTLEPIQASPKNDVNVAEIEKQETSSSTASIEESTTTDVKQAEDDWFYPHPTDFKLSEVPIDKVRELKVAVIGAGISGISRADQRRVDRCILIDGI